MGKDSELTDRELIRLAIAEAKSLRDATGLSTAREALEHIIDCLEGRIPARGFDSPTAGGGQFRPEM